MAVMVISRMDGGKPAPYDEVSAKLGVEEDPPAGLIVHAAGERDGDFEVVDIWESREQFEAFLNGRLRPTIKSVVGDEAFAAMPEAERTFVELEDLVVP
jgi:hypothetical protein